MLVDDRRPDGPRGLHDQRPQGALRAALGRLAAHDWRRWEPPGSEVESIERLGALIDRPMRSAHVDEQPDARRRSAGRWSPSTTRPASRTSPGRCTRPASRSSPPARPPRRIADAGRPGHQGRGAHRLPRVPRRPGQDPAPEGARRHPGRPPPRVAPRRSSRSSASSRSTWSSSNLYPFTDTVMTRRRRPTSASSRSTSAGPRWCAPPPRTTRRVAIVTSPGAVRRAAGRRARRRHHARAAAAARRRGVRAHRDVRRARRVLDGQRPHRHLRAAPASRPGSARTWDKAAVLRYGENPHQRAALYTSGFAPEAGLAQATQLHGKEMSYNNYVDADAARRAAYDFDEPGRRDHQARQPVRHRGRRRRRRGAPQGARLRPGLGVRRRDRHQRAGLASRWPSRSPRSSPRSSSRPATRTAPSRCWPRKKNVRVLECAPADRAAASRPAPISGGLLMQARDAIDADGRRRRRRPVDLDAGHRRAGLRASSSPTSRSPGGPAVR